LEPTVKSQGSAVLADLCPQLFFLSRANLFEDNFICIDKLIVLI